MNARGTLIAPATWEGATDRNSYGLWAVALADGGSHVYPARTASELRALVAKRHPRMPYEFSPTAYSLTCKPAPAPSPIVTTPAAKADRTGWALFWGSVTLILSAIVGGAR